MEAAVSSSGRGEGARGQDAVKLAGCPAGVVRARRHDARSARAPAAAGGRRRCP
jgi:hypothetical protein